MAETSGPHGPCTAPRRRCCPAWPWTATAWARPRQDACPPRACRALCRRGSTWPASTSTRTRVSALRCARPCLSPRIQNTQYWFCSSWPGSGAPLYPGRSVGVRRSRLPRRGDPGTRAEGSPEALAVRAARRALPGALRRRSGSPGDDPNPRAPAAKLGFSKSGREKNKQVPHPLGLRARGAPVYLLADALARARGPRFHSRLLRSRGAGSPARPERLGCREDGGPALDLSLRQAGGGPRETPRPPGNAVPGPRPR